MTHPVFAAAATAACLVLWSVAHNPAAAQASMQAISCDGPFAKDSSRAKLVAAFGAENVTDEEVDGAEGSTEKATVIFAKHKSRRIEVFWHDEEKRARPASISVKTPAAWPGPEGVRNGMALSDVAARNGQPFRINGFEWDYGGFAVDLKGKLASLAGGCSMTLRFSPGVELSGKNFQPLIGEKKITSTNALLLSVKPTLTQWSVGYPE